MKVPCCLLLSAAACFASDPLDAARAALEDGFPQVAVQKLRESAVPKTDPAAVVLMARALLESGRADEALALLQNAGPATGREGDFTRASALAALGKWSDALALYQTCAGDASFQRRREALIGTARMQVRLGRSGEAESLLATAGDWEEGPLRSAALLDLAALQLDRSAPEAARRTLDLIPSSEGAQNSRRSFLLAGCLAELGDARSAVQLYEQVKPLDAAMAIAVVTGRARALKSLGDDAAAENLLEDFIESHPTIDGLESVFSTLDRIYLSEKSPSTAELKRWTDDDTDSQRRTLALFFRARMEARENRNDVSERLMERFIQKVPDHPLAAAAALELALNRLQSGRAADALVLLPGEGKVARADFVRGLALSAQGDLVGAARSFRLAAGDPDLAEVAFYNAALCELRAGLTVRSLEDLRTRFPNSPRVAEFRLQEGLESARRRDPSAGERLSALSAEPDTSISGAAGLALAEWNFALGRRNQAQEELKKVSTAADPNRVAALDVYLTDTGDPSTLESSISSAQDFLKTHAGAPTEPDVRMKLGELLYRKGDFAGARLQFETLARSQPGSKYEEPALFLAGQSAARLLSPTSANDALLLFEEVAAMNGTLALRARFEQAVLQTTQGRAQEALVILDRIISSQPDTEMRSLAIMEKGKTLFLLGATNPASYREAIAVWKALASDSATPAVWRNQALARAGTAYEKLGETDAAIAAFYDVIRPGQGTEPEYFWFYKAGFDAARLLESAQRWDEAVRVYEMISASEGPRAAEARARINKIRLENFLWDGN